MGVVLVLVLRQRPRVAGALAIGALFATLVLALWAVTVDAPAFVWRWREGMSLGMSLEGFSRVMAILVPLIALPVVGYATAAEGEEGGPRLLAWLLGFAAAMEVLVLANDFLTLLIGWELVGACSWALIGYRWRDAARPRAAAQAFLTTRFGDLGLYLAAAAAFAATGSLAFADLAYAQGPYLHVVAAGVLLAAAAKSGQVPFAPWLFSAMAGPTPASALLHSATMVAAGAYALIRLWPWLEPVPWLGPTTMGIGLVTMIAGGIVAALQTDFKKALAGSTSSQYGLMFLATGVGSTSAAGAHLLTHAAYKSLLFLGAGIAIHAVGTGRLDRLRLGAALPLVAAFVTIGALSLAAVPPSGGAFSKEAVLAAATHASGWLGAIVLLGGALTAFYAGRLLLLAFGPRGPRIADPKEAAPFDASAMPVRAPSRAEIAGLGTLAGLTVLLTTLWLPGAATFIERAVSPSLVESEPWELFASAGSVGLAAIFCFWLWRDGSLFTLKLRPKVQDGLANWLGLPVVARWAISAPVLRLSATLARFDDRVIDAGVWVAVAVGKGVSDAFSWRGEKGIDGAVEGLARMTLLGANKSMNLDDVVVDGAVEGTARLTGAAGLRTRRLQTGLTHHYYSAAAAGLLVLIGVALLWR